VFFFLSFVRFYCARESKSQFETQTRLEPLLLLLLLLLLLVPLLVVVPLLVLALLLLLLLLLVCSSSLVGHAHVVCKKKC
jgi:hypothetical protein